MSHEGPNSAETKANDWKGIKEDVPDNFYSRLGLDWYATDEQISNRFRELSPKHHPDRAGGDEQEFKRLSEAWTALKTPEARKKYHTELLFESVDAYTAKRKNSASPSASEREASTEGAGQNKESAGSSAGFEHVDMNSEDWKRRRAEYEERVRSGWQQESEKMHSANAKDEADIQQVRERMQQHAKEWPSRAAQAWPSEAAKAWPDQSLRDGIMSRDAATRDRIIREDLARRQQPPQE